MFLSSIVEELKPLSLFRSAVLKTKKFTKIFVKIRTISTVPGKNLSLIAFSVLSAHVCRNHNNIV